jgi:hypothetical protein
LRASVSAELLAVVGIVAMVAKTPFLAYWWVDMIAHWKDLRMSHDWSLTPPQNEGEARIRNVYTRALPIELVWVIGAALIVIATLAR